MATVNKTIDHGTLRRMVEEGASPGAEVVGQAGGWGVVISLGRAKQTLVAQRGQPRTFRKFETVAGYLKDLGITDLRVQTGGFTSLVAEKSPDARGELAAQRMRAAHAAAAHDRWFRDQVEQALAESSSSDAAPSVSHEAAKANMARQREMLRARLGKVR